MVEGLTYCYFLRAILTIQRETKAVVRLAQNNDA